MERLHQVMLGGLLLSFVLGLPKCWSQDPCPLVVRVLSPDGRRPEAPITVREQSGRTIEKDQEDKDVRFCDLGILPVEVRVGSDGMCNQVEIHDVPVSLEKKYLLKVTYDPEACQETVPPPVPICEVLIRVSDAKGAWVPAASVVFSGTSLPIRKTDQYGRARVVVKAGTRVDGSVVVDGVPEARFGFECTKSTPLYEKNVQLTKR